MPSKKKLALFEEVFCEITVKNCIFIPPLPRPLHPV